MAAALVAVLLAVLVPAGAASADQASAVSAQISALRDRLAAAGRQVHDLTLAYSQDSLRLGDLSAQLAADRARARQAGARERAAAGVLRTEAVLAYVGAYDGTPGGVAPVAAGSTAVADPAVRQGYVDVASGTLDDSLDAYRAARVELGSALTMAASAQQQAEATAAAADRARQDAVAEASTLSGRIASMQAQLVSLEQQAPPATTTAAGPVRPPQGGPVLGGLVALVRAQTAAPAPPAPAPTRPSAPPAAAPPVRAAARPAPPAPPVTAPPATKAPPATVPPTTAPPVTAPPVTAPPVTAPPVTVAPPSTGTTGSDGGAGGVWLQLRQCESGDDYQADTGNGFYGAYQFSQQTWTGLGFPGRPDLEPPAMQDQAAMKLQAEAGWGQWPACSAALGLT